MNTKITQTFLKWWAFFIHLDEGNFSYPRQLAHGDFRSVVNDSIVKLLVSVKTMLPLLYLSVIVP